MRPDVEDRNVTLLALARACAAGCLNEARQLADKAELSEDDADRCILSYEACRHDRVQIVQWLVARFGYANKSDCLWHLFEEAGTHGALGVARWLVGQPALGGADARARGGSRVLTTACYYGRLEFARWLVATFGLTAADIRAADNAALRDACHFGHVEVAQWLTDHFGLGPADARACDNDALRWACFCGQLAAAQWLAATFGLGPADARADGNYALRHACRGGHVEVVAWLVTTFGLGLADFHDKGPGGIHISAAHGARHPAMSQWLAARWPALGAAAAE